MKVSIRPAWVLSIGVMVVMFIVARIYVGQAIERETRQVRPVQAPAPRVEKTPAPPIERPVDLGAEARGRVLAPLGHITAVVEASDEAGRQGFYEAFRRDALTLDGSIAAQVPADARQDVLERYDEIAATPDAAPVRDELAALRSKLERWFEAAPVRPVPRDPDPDEGDPSEADDTDEPG